MKSPVCSPCAISRMPEKLPDAVLRVDHVVAGLQIGDVRLKGSCRGAGRRRLRDQIGGIEQILRAEDRQLRIRERDAALDSPFDQIGARDGAGQIGAFREIGGRGLTGVEAELERHPVFRQDVGQAFEFTVGRREERHAPATLHDRPRFCYGHLHVAVKRHGRARGDVQGLRERVRDQIQFADN